MFRCFFPDEYLDSAYVIDYDRLYREGYRGLIYDIDNTLVPHGAPADERAIALFAHLRELGFGYCLLSNNQMSGFPHLQMRLAHSLLRMRTSHLYVIIRKQWNFLEQTQEIPFL